MVATSTPPKRKEEEELPKLTFKLLVHGFVGLGLIVMRDVYRLLKIGVMLFVVAYLLGFGYHLGRKNARTYTQESGVESSPGQSYWDVSGGNDSGI